VGAGRYLGEHVGDRGRVFCVHFVAMCSRGDKIGQWPETGATLHILFWAAEGAGHVNVKDTPSRG